MKKILNFIFLLVVLTSCLAKVDLEKNTGSLSINIGAGTKQSSGISRAITSDTTKIIISLYHVDSHTNITRTISYSAGQSYNIEIKDLLEGEWDLHIVTLKETGSSSETTGMYFDFIEIQKNKDTVITHKFGSPQRVLYAEYGTGQFSGMDAPFIGDKETMSGMIGYIGFLNFGSTYNVGGYYNPNPSYDHVSVQFIMSKDPEMKKDFVRYLDGSNYLNYYPATATVSPDGSGSNYAKAEIGIAYSVSNNTFDTLEMNTTYYWKAIVTNSIGTTESKIFSFTTLAP